MKRPYTIGVTGGSGSGKTHFLKLLASSFTEQELCLLSQDHYYKPKEKQLVDSQGIKNVDLPDSIDRELLHNDILKLKKGESISKMEYAFNNPKATPKQLTFHPAPVLIIEGLFVQYFPEIANELDLKIFIEAKDHIKLARRIKRDNEERGYGLEDVLYRYQHHVMPVFESLIEPLKQSADLIIPNNHYFERALGVLVLAIRSKINSPG